MRPIIIVSWNTQGGAFAGNIPKINVLHKCFNKGYDFICIQEATEPIPAFTRLDPLGKVIIPPYSTHKGVDLYIYPNTSLATRSSPRTEEKSTGVEAYCCYYYRWGKTRQHSLVTYVKSTLIRSDNFGAFEYEDGDEIRPMLWVQVPGENFIIGNVHLPSGKEPFASKAFNEFKSVIASKGRPYAIVGDFNMDNKYLDKRPDKEYFHSVTVPTQSRGKTLDHVYCENGKVIFNGEDDIKTSDHRFLKITLYPNSIVSKRKPEADEQAPAAKRRKM